MQLLNEVPACDPTPNTATDSDDIDQRIKEVRAELDFALSGRVLCPDKGVIEKAKQLSESLTERYERTYSGLQDLDASIQIAEQIFALVDENDSARDEAGNALGMKLCRRIEASKWKSKDDMNRAVNTFAEILENTPEDHPHRFLYLKNYGVLMGIIYDNTGAADVLNGAIELFGTAVRATETSAQLLRAPKGTQLASLPKDAYALANLPKHLRERHERVGAQKDLFHAIKILDTLVAIIRGDVDRSRLLRDLNACLISRFEVTPSLKDIERGLKLTRMELNCFSGNSIRRASSLAAHSHWHIARDQCDLNHTRDDDPMENDIMAIDSIDESATGERCGHGPPENSMHDPDTGLFLLEEAISRTPEGHPELVKHLTSLGMHCSYRAHKFKSRDDLNRAIVAFSKARDATDVKDPRYGTLSDCLATCQGMSFQCGGRTSAELYESASTNHLTALFSLNIPTSSRVKAGIFCFELYAQNNDWEGAFSIAGEIIRLLPKLAHPSLQNAEKQSLATKAYITGFASDAAAAAVLAMEEPYAALYLLETGRGVVASSIEDMRADLMELRAEDPELESTFRRLRDELSRPVRQGSRHYRADVELDGLLDQIHTKTSLKRFLLAPSLEEMRDAAKLGPIAVVNVSVYGCHAFLIKAHKNVEIVALKELHVHDIEKYSRSDTTLNKASTLAWLWNVLAEPVLTALGYTQPIGAMDSWPRMWWIPTGLLGKIPLHAAGLHLTETAETVLDRVLSSYSSSTKAIIEGRRRQTQSQGQPMAVLVAMKDTPGQSWGRLDYAEKETKMVRELCPSLNLKAEEPPRLKSNVLSHLTTCKVFHFAGHGYTDSRDPSNSTIILDDWQTNSLTVKSLQDLNLREQTPFLAYLSACGTGQVVDVKFLDESIHIISACQLAGFRHVIGTLWEVNDEYCVGMAKVVYETMRDEGMTDEAVAWGLHQATLELRKNWLGGPRAHARRGGLTRKGVGVDSSSDDEEDEAPAHWAPYVHFGV